MGFRTMFPFTTFKNFLWGNKIILQRFLGFSINNTTYKLTNISSKFKFSWSFTKYQTYIQLFIFTLNFNWFWVRCSFWFRFRLRLRLRCWGWRGTCHLWLRSLNNNWVLALWLMLKQFELKLIPYDCPNFLVKLIYLVKHFKQFGWVLRRQYLVYQSPVLVKFL